jgi:putative intracellular protease/amidase
MIQNDDFTHPISWTSPDFNISAYDLVFLTGGHEKSVRQVYDSTIVQRALAEYFPQTEKPSKKHVAAICHGVLGLSEAKLENGKSVLHDATTTALPGMMEQGIFWGTRLVLGDYYKTYGADSESVETAVSGESTRRGDTLKLTGKLEVRKKLDNPENQWKSSLTPTP